MQSSSTNGLLTKSNSVCWPRQEQRIYASYTIPYVILYDTSSSNKSVLTSYPPPIHLECRKSKWNPRSLLPDTSVKVEMYECISICLIPVLSDCNVILQRRRVYVDTALLWIVSLLLLFVINDHSPVLCALRQCDGFHLAQKKWIRTNYNPRRLPVRGQRVLSDNFFGVACNR